VSAMVSFSAVVTSDFWTTQRGWPAGCRPVIYSMQLVTKNAGTLSVPSVFANAVEELLRAHPEVLVVESLSDTAAPFVASELLQAA
jgi:hypothetical protein